jgi:maleylpyruvate isomerase
MATTTVKLYGYWRSSSAWRVRIALGWKGIAFVNQPVHLVRDGGEQHGETYRALNPMEEVPTLEWEAEGQTRRLGQSLAIMDFLERVAPSPPLWPSDPFLRGRAQQLAEVVNSGTQPLQNMTVLKRVKETLRGDEVAWAQHFISRGLAALESLGGETAGQFLVGDAVSIADVCLVPQLYSGRRYGVDTLAYPLLSRVEAACCALPAFIAAHPDQQPDAPPAAA